MEIKENMLILMDMPLFVTAKHLSTLFNNVKFKNIERKNKLNIKSFIELEFPSNDSKQDFLKKYQNYKLKDSRL